MGVLDKLGRALSIGFFLRHHGQAVKPRQQRRSTTSHVSPRGSLVGCNVDLAQYTSTCVQTPMQDRQMSTRGSDGFCDGMQHQTSGFLGQIEPSFDPAFIVVRSSHDTAQTQGADTFELDL